MQRRLYFDKNPPRLGTEPIREVHLYAHQDDLREYLTGRFVTFCYCVAGFGVQQLRYERISTDSECAAKYACEEFAIPATLLVIIKVHPLNDSLPSIHQHYQIVTH